MLSRLTLALNWPLLSIHELCHYLAARALGMDATRHATHTTFYPDEGDDVAILIVTLAPTAVALALLAATIALLVIRPHLWIIPVHTGLLGLWLLATCLSDIHSAGAFLRHGRWPAIDDPDQLETVSEWLGRRLRGRI